VCFFSCLLCIVVSCLVFIVVVVLCVLLLVVLCILLLVVLCIVVVVLCVLLSSYMYLLYYVCIAVFTLDARLLARSQYPEGTMAIICLVRMRQSVPWILTFR